MTTEEEVSTFLRRFQELYKSRNISVVRIPEHRQDLAQLGMTYSDRDTVIMSLTCMDYFKGPENDDKSYRNFQYWFFGKFFESKEIYIKLTILDYVDSETKQRIEQARIVSFKQNNGRIIHPY